MRKRFGTVALVTLVIIGLVSWETLRPHEPEYKGKRLSAWLEEYNTAGSMDKTKPASAAIRAMGTNCLPFLLANIKHNNSPLKQKIIKIVGKQHLIKIPFYGDDPYRNDSVLALSVLGYDAAPLCSELLKVAEKPETRWLGNLALLAIGPESIPTLARVCQSTNEAARNEAVLMISMLKSMPAPWFSWGWGTDSVNGRPIFILGYAVSNDDVRGMIKLLEDPDAAVRCASAEAISLYSGPAYKSVIPSAVAPLIKALNDTNAEVRISAGKALKIIDPVAAANAGVR